jgi:hypothetical protein
LQGFQRCVLIEAKEVNQIFCSIGGGDKEMSTARNSRELNCLNLKKKKSRRPRRWRTF